MGNSIITTGKVLRQIVIGQLMAFLKINSTFNRSISITRFVGMLVIWFIGWTNTPLYPSDSRLQFRLNMKRCLAPERNLRIDAIR